jgi:site-specific recombinase XerD
VDIQTVADILGHSSVTTTQRYAAVLEQNKQNATNALDNLF